MEVNRLHDNTSFDYWVLNECCDAVTPSIVLGTQYCFGKGDRPIGKRLGLSEYTHHFYDLGRVTHVMVVSYYTCGFDNSYSVLIGTTPMYEFVLFVYSTCKLYKIGMKGIIVVNDPT